MLIGNSSPAARYSPAKKAWDATSIAANKKDTCFFINNRKEV